MRQQHFEAGRALPVQQKSGAQLGGGGGGHQDRSGALK
jgi:hypothetical protein